MYIDTDDELAEADTRDMLPMASLFDKVRYRLNRPDDF
jgi:hypothetical protein